MSKVYLGSGERPHRGTFFDRSGLAVLAILFGGFIFPITAAIAMGLFGHTLHEPPVELRVLIFVALLALALPLLQIAIHIRRFGGTAVRGNRDGYPRLDGLAARVSRAHANMIESLLPFAAVTLSSSIMAAADLYTEAASVLYLAARLVHAISYILGITVVRSAAYYAGVIATVVIGLRLPLM
jgi:uncharacterized MAPEG superfamily protein